MNFNDKTVLVTGVGGPGTLGHAIAVAFNTNGAKLIVSGRHPDTGSEVVAQLGNGARFIEADLLDVAQITKLATAAGKIDILINNAACMVGANTLNLDAESFDAMYATNVRAPYLLTTATLPGMIAQGRGAIVNISSMGASIGTPGRGAYVATKAALESLTRSFAVEYARAGIQVNAIAPGPMHSERFLAAVGDNLAAVRASVPIGRTVSPDEVAAAVLFLSSEDAAYAAGTIMAFDGGRTVA